MSEEIQCEVQSILSKELCAEAIRKIFLSTKFNKRILDLIVAIVMSFLFIIFFTLSLIDADRLNMLLSFAMLVISAFLYFSYFRGYSFPKTMYLQKITILCTPPTRQYIFKQTQFEDKTEQSTRIIFYSQIKQMIDSKNLLILLTSNQEYIINKKYMPDNYGELITLIRNSSHCSYWK